jgi:hypothetical protein
LHRNRFSKNRLSKLAEKIDCLAEKDDSYLRHAREIEESRRGAAVELHAICARFVENLNRLLQKTSLVMDPPEYGPDRFFDHAPNLFQINVRGRILQLEFRATDELVSTEEFRIPYTLQGSIRSFSQQLLDQHVVREHWLFYCLEKDRRFWRYFDDRTYRSGAFDEEYLTGLMEELL